MALSVPLPVKEMSLYNKAKDCKKRLQYKNGLRYINQILSTPGFEKHPESLALKGLLTYFTGKKEDGHDLVREGIKSNIKSAVCWQTFGKLNLMDRQYEDAIKCLVNSLRWRGDNLQVLQELSVLQIQLRDYDGFLESRLKIIQIAPQHRESWAGLAVGYHLLYDYESCLDVLLEFRKILTCSAKNCSAIEYSSFLLYENSIIEESGDSKKALNHLTENQEYILDKFSLQESFFRLHYMEKNVSEAESYLQQLLLRNPNNTMYYERLFEILEITSDKNKYMALKEILTRSKADDAKVPRILLLNYSEGDDFLREIDIYLEKGLRRELPALFVEIKPLYSKDMNKVAIIEKMMLSYLECLIKDRVLKIGNKKRESPSIILWVYYFLAQHYCYLKKFNEALKYIDLAIGHTSTVPELYITKGKIYKKAGNSQDAADCLFHAFMLDTKDRCLNSKCVKYFLQASRIKRAKEIAGNLVLDPNLVDEYLFSGQYFWYLLESALAYERLEMYQEALGKCNEIDRHFNNFYHDQFVYHDYALKIFTLRHYVDFLRNDSKIKRNVFFIEAYHCGIRIHVMYFDKKKRENRIEGESNASTSSDAGISRAKLTSSEKKKIKSKEKKANRKAESKQMNDKELSTIPDNPLEEASRILFSLQLIAENDVQTYIYAYGVYLRKKKMLLMLQSFKRGYAIAPNHGYIHQMIIEFTLLINAERSLKNFSPLIFEVIDRQMEPIWRGRTPEQINEEYIKKNEFSLEAMFHAAVCMYMIDPTKKSQALQLCTSLDDSLEDISVEICTRVLDGLVHGKFGRCDDEIEDYFIKCQAKFPLAELFFPFELDFCNLSLDEL